MQSFSLLYPPDPANGFLRGLLLRGPQAAVASGIKRPTKFRSDRGREKRPDFFVPRASRLPPKDVTCGWLKSPTHFFLDLPTIALFPPWMLVNSTCLFFYSGFLGFVLCVG